MRCREWYGWHFPELGKIITDNLAYCKTVRRVGKKDFSYLTVVLNDPISPLFYYGQVVNYAFWQEIQFVKIFKCIWLLGDRTNVATTDLSETLPEEIEAEVKLAAEISMGTEVSEQDINNIMHLCDQVCVVSTCS